MLKANIKQDGKTTIVELSGAIDEETNSALGELYSKASKDLIISFKDVDYINSLGIRSWINFIRHIEEGRSVTFRDCTPDVVMQMNLISNFRGNAKIESFLGEYTCDNCGEEGLISFKVTNRKELDQLIANQICPNCGSEFTLEEDEENYLQFLDES